MASRIFISHASEDKDAVARPLAYALKERGFEVWFDEFSLNVGDSLRQAIDKGLGECNFGIVVLSPSFFEKGWTNWELDGLVAVEIASRKPLILPVWHDVDYQEILEYSPPLANRFAVKMEVGIESVIGEIAKAVRAAEDLSRKGEIEPEIERTESAIPFEGYWDLEATSCGETDRRGWKTFSIRGFLDKWHHNRMEALAFAHLRTSFPGELFHMVTRGKRRSKMYEANDLDGQGQEIPAKSGNLGDFLFDLEPAYCLRVRALYTDEYGDVARIPYSRLGRFVLSGDNARRLEIEEARSRKLLFQVLFPTELEKEIVDGIVRVQNSHKSIEIQDDR